MCARRCRPRPLDRHTGAAPSAGRPLPHHTPPTKTGSCTRHPVELIFVGLLLTDACVRVRQRIHASFLRVCVSWFLSFPFGSVRFHLHPNHVHILRRAARPSTRASVTKAVAPEGPWASCFVSYFSDFTAQGGHNSGPCNSALPSAPARVWKCHSVRDAGRGAQPLFAKAR